MKRVSLTIAAALAIIAAASLAPEHAWAQRGMGGGPGMGGGGPSLGGGRPVVTPPIAGRPMGPRGFPSHPFFNHHFFRNQRFAYPYVVYAAPGFGYGYGYGYGGFYDDPPAYPDPPAAMLPPASPQTIQIVMATPPPAPASSVPPLPNVVQYGTGRYELRGDGVTAPYRWVWVPDPPPGPPVAAAPPAAAPPAAAPEPARRAELYRWTDEQGVLHLTDRLEIVPPKYRSQAKQPS